MSEWCYAAATKYQTMKCCRNGTMCNKHLKPTFPGKLEVC